MVWGTIQELKEALMYYEQCKLHAIEIWMSRLINSDLANHYALLGISN